MNAARRMSIVVAVALVGAVLAGCGSSVDEMIMNPGTKDEIIAKLVADDVAKRDIMTRLASNNDTKKEMAETLLGDVSIKAMALDKLTSDATQRTEIIKKLLADPASRGEVIAALTGDENSRKELQEILKKPLPKKDATKKELERVDLDGVRDHAVTALVHHAEADAIRAGAVKAHFVLVVVPVRRADERAGGAGRLGGCGVGLVPCRLHAFVLAAS